MNKLRYRKGCKIQVYEDLTIQTEIYPDELIKYKPNKTVYITLTKQGKLTVHAGYASDLASGPTFNTKSSRRGSVYHDALYELMRQKLLDLKWRKPADKLLFRVCVEDGMWEYRAKWWYRALQLADGNSALPENRKKIYTAP